MRHKAEQVRALWQGWCLTLRHMLGGASCSPGSVRGLRLRRACAALGVLMLLCGGGWLALGLVTPPPLLQGVPLSMVLLDTQGNLLRLGLTTDEKYRVYTPLHQISPQSVRAALLYEDRYFYQHCGVNPLSVARAIGTMLTGGRRLGGSTITMQVARLRLHLQTASLSGKLRQMWYALLYERHYSKNEILEAYFTLAPYGGNVEGIGAAARVYFHADPARLSLGQALALTPVPQNPVRRGPLAQNTGEAEGFDGVRQRIHRLWADAGEGVANPTPLRVYSPRDLPFAVPHLAAEVLEYGTTLPPAQAIAVRGQGGEAGTGRAVSQGTPETISGKTPETAPKRAPEISPAGVTAGRAASGQTATAPQDTHTGEADAYTRRLYIRMPLQRAMEGVLHSFAARYASYGINNAAVLAVHWPDMQVHALAGSADFFAHGISGQVDGTRARRSPGSVLKPFIYALALEQGRIHPRTLLPDAPRSFAGYAPENFDQAFHGPVPADEALRASRNVPAVWLASQLQPDLWSFLQRSGAAFPHSASHYGLALVLGGAEVSMRQVAEWYAMLANGGVLRPLRFYEGQTERGGVPLLSPEAAHVTLRMLEDRARMLSTPQGRLPLRCKTGTSNGFRDAWTAGVVGPYVLVVWVGNFDNTPNNLLIGGTVAEPLFEDLSRQLQRYTNLTDPIAAQAAHLGVSRLDVCSDTGDIDTSLCPVTTRMWFIPGRSPTASSGIYRKILVDAATGLRLCAPKVDAAPPATPPAAARQDASAWGKPIPEDALGALLAEADTPPAQGTRWEVHQFWPSDMRALFARAGITKPSPPPLAPQCADITPQGRPPRILSPVEGMDYIRRISEPERARIPLKAAVEADAHTVYWFSGTRSLGSSPVDQILFWPAEDGVHRLRVVDDLGRSTEQRVRVRTIP